MKPQSPGKPRHGPWLVFLPAVGVAVAAFVSMIAGPLPLNGGSGESSGVILDAFLLIFILLACGVSLVVLRRKHMI